MFNFKASSCDKGEAPAHFRWTEYEDRIRKARLEDSLDILSNLSSAHASIVINELVAQATEKKVPLRMLSGELFPGCYDDLTERVTEFLEGWDSGSHEPALRVILTDWAGDPGKTHKFYQAIATHTKGENPKVKIKTTNTNAPHFTVVDRHAYRFELDHETMEARLSFNHEELARKLVDYFDTIYEKSSDLN